MGDKFKALRSLSSDMSTALAEAEKAQALLEEIWEWIGPYGIQGLPKGVTADFAYKPETQKLVSHIIFPDKLRYKLQQYFNFDDSE